MVDARPCNVFVVLPRVRNSRTIIIIIIIPKLLSKSYYVSNESSIFEYNKTNGQCNMVKLLLSIHVGLRCAEIGAILH